MSNENTREWAEEQQKREKPQGEYATCLHCHNQFPVSKGVVTSEGALCDVCNGI